MLKRSQRLTLMYWYNIVVTGGFALLIAIMVLFPGLRARLAWPETVNPIVFSMVVPLFLVMAAFSVRALTYPERGTLLLQMQIAYKPFAIVLLLIFSAKGLIHPLWCTIIVIGLLIYIVGNLWALRNTLDGV